MKKLLIFAAICFCAFSMMVSVVLFDKDDDFQSMHKSARRSHSSGSQHLVGGNVNFGTGSYWEIDQRRIGITAVSGK